jgi:hypothetical protein
MEKPFGYKNVNSSAINLNLPKQEINLKPEKSIVNDIQTYISKIISQDTSQFVNNFSNKCEVQTVKSDK